MLLPTHLAIFHGLTDDCRLQKMLSVPKLTAKSFAQLRLPEDTRSVVGFGEHPTTGHALLQVRVASLQADHAAKVADAS